MASLANADLLSSDEEDDDYNPCADKSGEPGDRPGKGETQRMKRPRRAAAQGGGDEDNDDDDGDDGAAKEPVSSDAEEVAEEEEEEKAVDLAPNDPRRMAKRAKIDAVWLALNSRDSGGPNAAGPMGPPSNTRSLASLCGQNAKPQKQVAANPDLIWMGQLGMLPTKSSSAPKSAPAPSSGPLDGSNLVAKLWTEQLGMPPRRSNNLPPTSSATAATTADGAPAGDGGGGGSMLAPAARSSVAARELAAAAIVSAKEAATLGVSKSYGKVSVTETRRFAGKDIQVTVQVDKDSAAASKEGVKVSGLDAFLAELETKKKVSVLDKSKMDWDTLKSSDATMEEELETYKKSSNKYLDKVDFLKKAELREYEMERDKRLASDIRTRGRL